MTDPRIALTVAQGIARLTIRRPEKQNALDAAMLDTLARHCRAIEQGPARVVLLSAEGSRAFCAGGDIAAWSALTPEAFGRHWIRDGHAALDALARLTVPVVAVLNGDCLGGGLELAACADLRIAEAHVRLGQPEAALGIIPGWSGTQRALRRFGAQPIRRMALLGEVFSAEQALALGLVDQVVPSGQGPAAAEAVAARVLARAPRATELTKMLINAAEGEEGARVLDALAGAAAAAHGDLAEGLAAWRDRRPARFAPPD